MNINNDNYTKDNEYHEELQNTKHCLNAVWVASFNSHSNSMWLETFSSQFFRVGAETGKN